MLNINFGYKPPLEKYIDTDLATGKIVEKEDRVVVRVLPSEYGGSNSIDNFVVINKNKKRGPYRPLSQALSEQEYLKDNIQYYLDKYRGLNIDGINYVEVLKRRLNNEAKGEAVFKGSGKLDVKV